MKEIEDPVLREFYREVRDRVHAGCIFVSLVIGCGIFIFGPYELIAFIVPIVILIMAANLEVRLRRGISHLTPRELRSLKSWLDERGQRVPGLSLPG